MPNIVMPRPSNAERLQLSCSFNLASEGPLGGMLEAAGTLQRHVAKSSRASIHASTPRIPDRTICHRLSDSLDPSHAIREMPMPGDKRQYVRSYLKFSSLGLA